MDCSKVRGSSLCSSHQKFKSKAKSRVDDLQEIFTDLQLARKENRLGDVTLLEEQVLQMLREWKAELHEASPATSLLGESLSSSELSSDMKRLLQLHEEDDDASSDHKPQLAVPHLHQNCVTGDDTDFLVDNLHTPEQTFERVRRFVNGGKRSSLNGYRQQGSDEILEKLDEERQTVYAQAQEEVEANMEIPTDIPSQASGELPANMECLQTSEQSHEHVQETNFTHQTDQLIPSSSGGLEVSEDLDITQLDFHEDFIPSLQGTLTIDNDDDLTPMFYGPQPAICPPPAAFLGPKCALWDCPRPAQGTEWCQDYCCNYHGTLALKEGAPGMHPVLRPGGIELKDGPLFAALTAKTQDKAVGIPQCEGAATSKSPWNAHELFDICVLEGESVREWLFFDKPRRAFESGNRKQRSLPDYNGRGWHESRKQIMKDFGGLKRSYYMDPQPSTLFEWHLYEYEINDCDACALYRLELKAASSKKNVKGKPGSDLMVDLQHQIGKLSAEVPGETKRPNVGRPKTVKKNCNNNFPASHQVSSIALQGGYFVEGSNGSFSTH
eukprot:TRINITY_DN10674_c0_g1_i1.p1 TRINITY_DN10674_c0_g1~~TRINITY_DN10674_c0_g1_i1.p1  ORF type:complete len:554 (+),score=123.47 TRINITY_DN10674_c0_g1_i1:941-2602(+)